MPRKCAWLCYRAKLCPWSPVTLPAYQYYRGSLIARFMGPTWGPSGAARTQMGPMLAPWTLLSGVVWWFVPCFDNQNWPESHILSIIISSFLPFSRKITPVYLSYWLHVKRTDSASHNFVHATTAQLSRLVQNCHLIWSCETKLQHYFLNHRLINWKNYPRWRQFGQVWLWQRP